MSNSRYRSRPGEPRTEREAMIRAAAMELLDGALAELNQEISILSDTVELYRHELRKRRKDPDKEWGRWQVAPGVAMRAQNNLRKLRDRRDKMLADAEAEVMENAVNTPQTAKQGAAPADVPQPAKPDAVQPMFDWQAVSKAMAKHGETISSAGRKPVEATLDKRKPVPA